MLEPLISDQVNVSDQLATIGYLMAQKANQALKGIDQGENIQRNLAFLAIFDFKTDYKELNTNLNNRLEEGGAVDCSDLTQDLKQNLKLVNLGAEEDRALEEIEQAMRPSNKTNGRWHVVRNLQEVLDLDVETGRHWGMSYLSFQRGDFYQDTTRIFLNEDGTVSADKTHLSLGLNIGPVEINTDNPIEVTETRKNGRREIVYKGLNKITHAVKEDKKDQFTYHLETTDLGDKVKFSFECDFDSGLKFTDQGEISKEELAKENHQESWALKKIHSLISEAVFKNRDLHKS
jgi:hypothetical protein